MKYYAKRKCWKNGENKRKKNKRKKEKEIHTFLDVKEPKRNGHRETHGKYKKPFRCDALVVSYRCMCVCMCERVCAYIFSYIHILVHKHNHIILTNRNTFSTINKKAFCHVQNPRPQHHTPLTAHHTAMKRSKRKVCKPTNQVRVLMSI